MLLSVVIPVYNEIDFLPEVIEGVQEVPYKKGIIVVDERSVISSTRPIRRTTTGQQTPGGFTLIEVIMVILIIGILAAAFAYKYSANSDVALNVAADQLIADIRYVQARAMGTGKRQRITFTLASGQYTLSEGPEWQGLETKQLPDGVTVDRITPFNNRLTFNTLGEPTDIVDYRTISLAWSTEATRHLRVYAITGKVE